MKQLNKIVKRMNKKTTKKMTRKAEKGLSYTDLSSETQDVALNEFYDKFYWGERVKCN